MLKDWISCHIRMLEFFNGATEIITPNNPKVSVKQACWYYPNTQNIWECVKGLHALAVPTRVRHPKAKSKVALDSTGLIFRIFLESMSQSITFLL